jgi:7-cyano-7-deazaguanosine (preQ0) biosynthesis protein QueE
LERIGGVLKLSRKPDGQPEIFCSIQGEGVHIGKPAVFLRLGLCNLKCAWCDTKYAWDWETYDPDEQLVEMPLEDVEQNILRHNRKYLVVTGGEPMIQQNWLIPLLERLGSRGFFVEIETNGTLIPDQRLVKLVDHWSVSPKLQNSGNSQSLREVPECYRLFAGMNSSHFKYVIQSEEDFEEVQTIANKYDLVREETILMPEAQSRESLLDRSRWLVGLCKAHGYMFSTRLHILLWGNERGK